MPDARCPAVPVRPVVLARAPALPARPDAPPPRPRSRAAARYVAALVAVLAAAPGPLLAAAAGVPRASPDPVAADTVCVGVTAEGVVTASPPAACVPSPVATFCRDLTVGDSAVELVTVADCLPVS